MRAAWRIVHAAAVVLDPDTWRNRRVADRRALRIGRAAPRFEADLDPSAGLAARARRSAQVHQHLLDLRRVGQHVQRGMRQADV
jgi:hypothetical protein